MGSYFSKQPKHQISDNIVRTRNNDNVTDKDRAILNLKNARDKLRRYRVKLSKESIILENQARKLIAMKMQTRALVVLKLKRYKQKELDSLELKLLNIFTMIEDLEMAALDASILNAIEAGTRELNRIHEERTLDEVQDLLEETQDAIEVSMVADLLLFAVISILYYHHYHFNNIIHIVEFLIIIS